MIPKEQVNFVVTPKETKLTYSFHELSSGKKMSQSLTKCGSGKGKGWRKPADAIDGNSLKTKEKVIKDMNDNDTDLADSKIALMKTLRPFKIKSEKQLIKQRLKNNYTR